MNSVKWLLARSLASLCSRLPVGVQWRMACIVERIVQRHFCKDSQPCIVRRNGFIWQLDPGDYVCRDVYWFGAKDRHELGVILRNLRRGMCILDVGANFGYYSIMIARRLNNDCIIHAFEPNPFVFTRLNYNIDSNKAHSVKAHPCALGARRSVMWLEVDGSNTGAGVVSEHQGARAMGRVDVIDLDGLVPGLNCGQIDFVKLDIEGAEFDFLSGAKEVLMRDVPVLMVEVSPSQLKRRGCTVDELLVLLRSMGYESFMVAQPEGLVSFTEESFSGGWSYRNVFCLGHHSTWT